MRLKGRTEPDTCPHHWEPLRDATGALLLRCTRPNCGRTRNWTVLRMLFDERRRA